MPESWFLMVTEYAGTVAAFGVADGCSGLNPIRRYAFGKVFSLLFVRYAEGWVQL